MQRSERGSVATVVVECACLSQGLVTIEMDKGPHLLIGLRNAFEASIGQLFRRNFSVSNFLGCFDRGEFDQRGVSHGHLLVELMRQPKSYSWEHIDQCHRQEHHKDER